jgi:hypothetical protein
MAYQDYLAKFKTHLSNWSLFSSGKGSASTFDTNIDAKVELNALKNSASAEQLIQLGNAYYDQIAIGRAIKEMYKTPKDYYAQFDAFSKNILERANIFGQDVAKQHIGVQETIEATKASRMLSSDWQKKFANIEVDSDA